MTQYIVHQSQLFVKKFKFHIICWTAFIAYEIVAIKFSSNSFGSATNYVIYYTINICVFYLNALFLIPLALKYPGQAWWRAILYFSIQGACILILTFIIRHTTQLVFDRHETLDFGMSIKFIVMTLWRLLFYIAISIGYYVYREKRRIEGVKRLVEKRMLEQQIREKDSAIALSHAENALLLAKLNPHFLFSAFSYMKTESRKINHSFSQAVQLLADIMRYSFKSDQKQNKTPIEEEIEHVEYLIEFWKIIKSKELYIEIDVSEQALQLNFIPLVLITLTENMLKHGDLSNPKEPGLISIQFNHCQITIQTANNISKEPIHSGFQSGLENIRERLRHSYGDTASLISQQLQGKFFVEIVWRRE